MENKKIELLEQLELKLSEYLEVEFLDYSDMIKHFDMITISADNDSFINVNYYVKDNCIDIHIYDYELYVRNDNELKDMIENYCHDGKKDEAELLAKVYGIIVTYNMLFKMIDNSF